VQRLLLTGRAELTLNTMARVYEKMGFKIGPLDPFLLCYGSPFLPGIGKVGDARNKYNYITQSKTK